LRYSGSGHADAAFPLDGLDEECGEAFGFKLALQGLNLPERNRRCFGQKRSESLAPKGIVHQGKRAAREPVEGPLGVKQSGAAGMRARKLNRCFDSLTAGAAEKDPAKSSTSSFTETARQFSRQLGRLTLQHRGPSAVEFILDRRHDLGVIVPCIVDTIAGQKIQKPASVGGVKLRSQGSGRNSHSSAEG